MLRHDPVEGLVYRRLLGRLEHRADPDDTARGLACLDEDDDNHLVHSTSWRATDEGHIVLTYLVHPDPEPSRPATAVAPPDTIAHAARPGRPTPPRLATDHVATHAIRHLAFLSRTDPATTTHLAQHPDTRDALIGIPGHPAGRLPRPETVEAGASARP
ncbi:hypothetical protein OG896_39015 [Streptomyces sp. NBC_00669]|uniref:hypothetical protein n=1 Tax=unclassified Streptomyces TaxID=2593676 RepID=UPI002E2F55FB|nr:hypothetical protein [Streptomyces sp. NBC_00669]